MAESALQQVKNYFSVPGKPVTNEELIAFKKGDPEGFVQVRDGIVSGTLTY